MRTLIIVAAALMQAGVTTLAQTGSINGRVVDRSTREPLVGANVVIVGTGHGGATDVAGAFTLHRIPVGIVALKISLLGYQPLIRSDMVVVNTRTTTLDVEMEQSTIPLGEDVVVGAAYFFKPSENTTSVQSLSYEEIRRAPGAAGDISRMVQTLPGVVQTSDMRNDLIVRGGSPSENLNVIDGFEIPTINQFNSQGTSGGAIGLLQTEFISEANFMTGGFPASYGGKLSSVLDIRLRDGNREDFGGAVDVSMAGAGIIAEGPIMKGTTFLLSVRRSYLDLLLGSTGLTAVPHYTNVNAKFTHALGQNDVLSGLFLRGWDDIHIKQDPGGNNAADVSEDVRMAGGEQLVGLTWKHIFARAGYSSVRVWGTKNQFDRDINDFVRAPKGRVAQGHSTESQTGGLFAFMLALDRRLDVNAGFDARSVSLEYNMCRRTDTSWYGTPVPASSVTYVGTSMKGSAFFQASLRPFDPLQITGGIRLSYFDALKDPVAFDPRVGISYAVTTDLAFNASFGITHQAPELLWVFGSESPNRQLRFVKTAQVVAGCEYFPSPGTKLSVEGYMKRYACYPVSALDNRLSLANNGDAFTPNTAGGLVSEGQGTSYGVDVVVQKKLTDNVYGLVSYSYSRTRHRALDGIARPGSFDIPHVFTISGGYKFNTHWEVSSKFRFVSGRPTSTIDRTASQDRHALVYDRDAINAERYPDYWRWDVRVDYRTYFTSFNLVVYLDIQNVLNHKNIWGYNWNSVANEQVSIRQTGFFPVGGLKVEF